MGLKTRYLSVFGQTDSSGTSNILLPDAQDSTRLVTGSTGTITARMAYDAYGNLLGVTFGVLNVPTTKILYTGQLFDVTLLQYYLRARFYDPGIGRFVRTDPLGLAGGDAILYRYASGNPVTFDDPSGWLVETEEVVIGEGEEIDTWEVTPGMASVINGYVRATTVNRIISSFLLFMIGATAAAPALAPVLQMVLVALDAPAPAPAPQPPATDTGNSHCPPEYDYWPLDGQGRSTGAFAQFSSPQIRSRHVGFSSVGPGWWNATNLPVPPGASVNDVWQKGHLIASVLGGDGNTRWRNMTPLYKWANYPVMYEFAERTARDWARAGFCIQYISWPTYTGNNYYPDFVSIIMLADGEFLDAVDIPNVPWN
jgi:RHS repeat-associated protein